MFKHVLSALVVSSVMAGGAAFAADPATSSPQAQTAPTTKAEQVGTSANVSTTAKATSAKKHLKVAHKQEQVKASVVKTDTTKAVEATPAQSN